MIRRNVRGSAQAGAPQPCSQRLDLLQQVEHEGRAGETQFEIVGQAQCDARALQRRPGEQPVLGAAAGGFEHAFVDQRDQLSAFGAADAMYAPVVLRFRTYEVELPSAARKYYDAVLELPAMKEWIEAAEREPESIPQFDMYE